MSHSQQINPVFLPMNFAPTNEMPPPPDRTIQIRPKADSPRPMFETLQSEIINDPEMKRKIKKQDMERKRRACISEKLSTVHNLALSLVGGRPHQGSQRVEITDALNDCVNVLSLVSKFVESEPRLQARMRQLGRSMLQECEDRRKRRHRASSNSCVSNADVEVNKENALPQILAYSPVLGRVEDLPLGSLTSTPLAFSESYSIDSGHGPSSTFSAFNSPTAAKQNNPSEVNRSKASTHDRIWRPYCD